MPEEPVQTPKTAYPKTGLIVAATVLPLFGWAARQVFLGAKNAFNGKNNDPVIDDED